MTNGPAGPAAAHASRRPLSPDRLSSTWLSEDNDARRATPSVASVTTGFALFGSAPDASDDISGSGIALFGSGSAGAAEAKFALFRSGPAGPSGASLGGFALFRRGSAA